MNESINKFKDISNFNSSDERMMDIYLNHNKVFENADGAVVGLLDTVDDDSNDHYYTLQNYQDTFEIIGSELRVKDGVILDYESTNSYTLNIQATDTTGKNINKNFTINVLNQHEGLNNVTANDSDPYNDDLPYFIKSLYKGPRSHAGTVNLWGHDESEKIGGRNPLKFDKIEDFIGKERKLVYGFGNDGPAYTEAQKASVHKAMQYYKDRFGLKVEFNDNIQDVNNDADIVFYRGALGGITAGNTVTGGISHNGYTYWASSNKVYMDTGHYPDSNDLTGGAFRSLLHEIGHAIGLKHPFSGSDGYTLGGSGHKSEENTDNTIMAYRAGSRYWSEAELSHFDIAILEYMYGLNNSYRSGNDVYKYGNQKIISDGSGNDTLDASAITENLTVNLNPGSWNYTGETKSDSILADGQLFLGYDTIIENLKTGSGNDYITGNNVGNRIFAGAGNDIINGGNGNDIFYGGEGNDVLKGDVGNDILDGGKGVDHLYGGSGNDDLYYNESMHPQFNNTIHGSIDGGSGIDRLKISSSVAYNYGNSWDINNVKDVEIFDMKNNGRDGDVLSLWAADAYSANNSHTLIIDKDTGDSVNFVEGATKVDSDKEGYDLFITHKGYRTQGKVYISQGAVIKGEAASEILYGTEGDDIINGRGGNDKIYAGRGNDTIYYHEEMNPQGNRPHGYIDGEDGIDTLKILPFVAYNHGTSWDINNVKNVEIFDMRDNDRSGDALSLWAADAYFANDDHTIIVNKDMGDTVNFVQGATKVRSDKVGYDLYITNQNSSHEGKVYISNSNFIDGTNRSETINGTDNNDVINGYNGDDVINGYGGIDAINAGGGNDTIYYHEVMHPQGNREHGSIDGGAGIDTLKVLSSVAYNHGDSWDINNVKNVEVFDIKNNGRDGDVLSLWAADAYYANAEHTLIIDKDRSDTVNFVQGATKIESDKLGYDLYITNQGKSTEGKVYISQGAIINGTSQDETLRGSYGDDIINGHGGNDNIYAGEGDDFIYYDQAMNSQGDNSHGSIDGGAGIDMLKILSSVVYNYGESWDINNVSNVEIFDMQDNGRDGDVISLWGADANSANPDHTLIINKDANDEVRFVTGSIKVDSDKEGYDLYITDQGGSTEGKVYISKNTVTSYNNLNEILDTKDYADTIFTDKSSLFSNDDTEESIDLQSRYNGETTYSTSLTNNSSLYLDMEMTNNII